MIVKYYNKNFKIDADKISTYHLLIKSLERINQKNIDDYYLTTLEGHPLKNSAITNKNQTYILKKKLKGAEANNMADIKNSEPTINFAAVIFGFGSVIYYWIYLKLILTREEFIDPKIDLKMSNFAYKNTPKHLNTQNGGKSIESIPDPGNKSKVREWFEKNMKDESVTQYFCYFRGAFPEFRLKEEQGSFIAVFTSIVFFLFLFLVFFIFFSNAITSGICKNPNPAAPIMGFLIIFIPLLVSFFSDQITLGLDALFCKINKFYDFQGYKLLVSNIILLVVLIVFMASNSKKGVADSVWGFMFILIVIFGLLSYKIAGKYSLDSIFSKISAKISNFIVSTTAISRVPENNSKVKPARIRNSKYDPIPKTKEEQNLLPFMNVKECFERFEVFFFAIKGYFLYVIGYAFMSFMFADQLNKACYS